MSEEEKALNWAKEDIEYLENEFKNKNFAGEFMTINDETFKYFKLIYELVLKLQKENKLLCKQLDEQNDLANEYYKKIDKAIKEIKKELEENHHLSYGVALTIINMLDNYKFLEGGK